jgi:hypothetical protein
MRTAASAAALVFALNPLSVSAEVLHSANSGPMTSTPDQASNPPEQDGAVTQVREPVVPHSLWTGAEQLPPTVIAALIGFAGAILVAALTQLAAAWLQSRSLNHAAAEQRAQEERAFKCATLLEGIEALADLQMQLVRIVNRRDDAPFEPRGTGALAKIQLVVSGETLRAFLDASDLFSRAAFQVATMRLVTALQEATLKSLDSILNSGASADESKPNLT